MATKEELEKLQEKAREVAAQIQQACPLGVGFALLMFEFGEGGHLVWISNAQREDMVRALEEFVERAKTGENS